MSSLVSLKTTTCGAIMPLGYCFSHTICCSNQTLPSQNTLISSGGWHWSRHLIGSHEDYSSLLVMLLMLVLISHPQEAITLCSQGLIKCLCLFPNKTKRETYIGQDTREHSRKHFTCHNGLCLKKINHMLEKTRCCKGRRKHISQVLGLHAKAPVLNSYCTATELKWNTKRYRFTYIFVIPCQKQIRNDCLTDAFICWMWVKIYCIVHTQITCCKHAARPL